MRHDATHDTTRRMTVEEVARALKLSPGAVRKRLERGQLIGVKTHGVWLIDLPPATAVQDDAPAPNTPMRRDATATRRDSAPIVSLQAQLAAMTRERDLLAADKVWLQKEVEARGVELAELRRLLLGAQIAATPTLAAPARAERPENAPNAADVAQTPPRRWWAFWRR